MEESLANTLILLCETLSREPQLQPTDSGLLSGYVVAVQSWGPFHSKGKHAISISKSTNSPDHPRVRGWRLLGLSLLICTANPCPPLLPGVRTEATGTAVWGADAPVPAAVPAIIAEVVSLLGTLCLFHNRIVLLQGHGLP